MLNLTSTPYSISPHAEKEIVKRIGEIEERVLLLRKSGTLTEQTLIDYYGAKRFEQVAESNAIEGSTLSAHETELAVLKGITTTGHDPAYIRDAKTLDSALMRLTEMAKEQHRPTDKTQLSELHALILGDRPGAGLYRCEPVRIKGSPHRPPETWDEIITAMEQWENWSTANSALPAIVRATILHAWLTHIHPFIDGNGRTARAISNLELVRAGYPPVIIKKKERDRYMDALMESDAGGDILAFFELMLDRADGALTGLELSARQQGYSPVIEKIRNEQTKFLKVWENSVSLLANTIQLNLDKQLKAVNGQAHIKEFETPLDVDEYTTLIKRGSVSNTWCFIVNITIPGLEKIERLAYVQYRSPDMFHHMEKTGGVSLFWSKKNPAGFPKWISDNENAPYCVEMTNKAGNGDSWHVRHADNSITRLTTSQLAKKIAEALIELAASNKP